MIESDKIGLFMKLDLAMIEAHVDDETVEHARV
jgi:hypothetical protein